MSGPSDDRGPHSAFARVMATLAQQVSLALDPNASLRGSAPLPDSVQATLPTLALLESSEGSPPGSRTARVDLEIRERIGEGGMGIVHSAWQAAVRREVAVKRLHPKESANGGARAALLEEGLHTGGLEHPNIVPVHLLGIDTNGQPLLVMKRVVGESWLSLQQRERRDGTLPDSSAHLRILLQVCNALAYAHSRGILHRDVKPENVMIGPFGEVYLMDWGVALDMWNRDALQSTSVVGTPVYMAPEMLQGASETSVSADVYLLGAVLHELLVGKPPHKGTNLEQAFASVLSSTPLEPAPNLPSELVAVRNRAMHPDPLERYASVRQFADAVELYLEHRSARAITTEALARLSDLEAILAGDTHDAASIARLFDEARFGLRMGLDQWAGNDAARSGLQRCLSLMAAHHLSQDELAAADRLLQQLPTRDAALEAAVRTAREREHRSGNPMLRIDRRGVIVAANEAARPVLGALPASVGQALPGYAKEALSSPGAELSLAVEDRVLRLSAHPDTATGGATLRARDITDLARAEHLTDILARFPEENPNPVMRLSADGTVEYANPASRPLVEAWSAEPGKRVTDVVRAHLARADEAGTCVFDTDHGERVFAVQVVSVSDYSYLYVYARDVTELRASERRTEVLARFPEENPNPVMRASSDGRLEYANPAALLALGPLGIRPGATLPGAWQHAVIEAADTRTTRRITLSTPAGPVELSCAPLASGTHVYVYGQAPAAGLERVAPQPDRMPERGHRSTESGDGHERVEHDASKHERR